MKLFRATVAIVGTLFCLVANSQDKDVPVADGIYHQANGDTASFKPNDPLISYPMPSTCNKQVPPKSLRVIVKSCKVIQQRGAQQQSCLGLVTFHPYPDKNDHILLRIDLNPFDATWNPQEHDLNADLQVRAMCP